jgi:dTDP-4-dehydrorhamnose 3,5-epimerase
LPFKFKKLKIPEIVLVESKSFIDERGFFLENYNESEFVVNGIKTKFIQDNFSHSFKSVIRGLHYQNNPKAQAKLVSVLRGEIFDVAVDIRKNSPTFGNWVGEILSHQNNKSLFIPEGFAHGFCVLSENADVYYKVNKEYSPENEGGIIWNDPDLNIKWPIENPICSPKDLQYPFLKNSTNNF